MAKKATKANKPKGRIAAASMSGGSRGSIGPGLSSSVIEQAMGQAVLDALAAGITDHDEILKLKLAARERVKAEAKAAAAAAEKESAD
jgi:hypothetical protein